MSYLATGLAAFRAFITTDTGVSDDLLHPARGGSVPGATCGGSFSFRLSTAMVDAVLTEAIARIARAVPTLSPTKAAR